MAAPTAAGAAAAVNARGLQDKKAALERYFVTFEQLLK
jgi:hypothetical protein